MQSKPERPSNDMLDSTSSPGGALQGAQSEDLKWLEGLSESAAASEDVPSGSWLDALSDDVPTSAEALASDESLAPDDAPAPGGPSVLGDASTSDVGQDSLADGQPGTASAGCQPPDRGAAEDASSASEADLPSMKDELRSVSPAASFRVLRDAFRQWRKEHSLFLRVLFNIVRSLIVVAAAAVLIVTLVLPILRISGDSMTDTLEDRDVVVALRGSDCETGDVIAFYYNNKILVKRVIANSGQWVDIDRQGNVFVDGVRLDEPYVTDRSLGECNIKLPYQVPEDRLFVMGDHRSTSIDSRNTAVGCVSDEQIVGRLVFCAWPLTRFGGVG